MALRYFHCKALEQDLRDFIFELVEANVRPFYEQCTAMGGWDAAAMTQELFDPEARYAPCRTRCSTTTRVCPMGQHSPHRAACPEPRAGVGRVHTNGRESPWPAHSPFALPTGANQRRRRALRSNAAT